MRVAAFLILLSSAVPAHAYMGPGAGLAFLGSLIALIAAVGVGVLGLVWYPLKRLLRRASDEDHDPS
jgi:hypothetical protein